MEVCPQADTSHLGRMDIRSWRPTSIGAIEELPRRRPRGLGERGRGGLRDRSATVNPCRAFARRRLKINVALVPSKQVRFLAHEGLNPLDLVLLPLF